MYLQTTFFIFLIPSYVATIFLAFESPVHIAKVRHELSKFGYYRIEKRQKLSFSKLTFPNYFERSEADTYLVTELRNLFIYWNL